MQAAKKSTNTIKKTKPAKTPKTAGKTLAQVRTTAKKTVAKVAPVSKLAAALQQAKSDSPTVRPTLLSGQRPKLANKVLVAAWILVIAGALYYFKGQFIVATVNGQPIFRSTLIKELEAQSGAQILDSLILETLVRQEAAAKKISVSDDEIAAEIKKLEDRFAAQKQNLDQLLAAQGMNRTMLKEQMRLQLLVEKMVDKNSIAVTDDEVKKYLDDNKAFLPKDVKPESLTAEVKTQLQQQKVTTKTQELFKNLQTKARINRWLLPASTAAPMDADQAL